MNGAFYNNENRLSIDRPKNDYTLKHAVFAIFAFVLGTLWFRWILMNSLNVLYDRYNGAWITLYAVLFVVFEAVYFNTSKINVGNDTIFMLIFSLIVSLRFSFYYREAESVIFMLALIVLHISVLVAVRCAGNKASLDNIVGETAFAVFVDPFISFHAVFSSLSGFWKNNKDAENNTEKGKKISLMVGFIIAGFVISIPILMVVFILLLSDSWFVGLLESIGKFFSGVSCDFNVFEFINPASVLVSMYIFGAIYTADKRLKEEKKTPINVRVVPVIIIKTVVVSLLAVYALFAISQITGFAAIISGNLPQGHTYASFARSGFFELCVVGCINGAVLFYSHILADVKSGEKQGTWLKYLLTGFTLFLIATAASKMCLYISVYGFTPKRFYTLWFMLLLAVLFVMTLFKLKNNALKLSRYSVYVTCVMLVILFMVDFEGIALSLNNMFFAW